MASLSPSTDQERALGQQAAGLGIFMLMKPCFRRVSIRFVLLMYSSVTEVKALWAAIRQTLFAGIVRAALHQ